MFDREECRILLHLEQSLAAINSTGELQPYGTHERKQRRRVICATYLLFSVILNVRRTLINCLAWFFFFFVIFVRELPFILKTHCKGLASASTKQ
jgi:hypothetical protein